MELIEKWKPIDFIENIDSNSYEISNFGRVKSIINPKNNKILKPRSNGRINSLNSVRLCSNKYSISVYIHKLVAIAFIPNPNNFEYIRHIDGDNKNNCVNNLEWCNKSKCSTTRKENKYIKIDNNTYKLVIDNKVEILFDSEDYELVSSLHWRINMDGYAQSNNKLMHRLILNNPEGIVDHIDHNRLNNKKENLRVCTPLENAENRDMNKSKYGVLGVRQVSGKWIARIQYKGVKYNLGTYNTYDEAAKARIKKEIELFGEFSSQKQYLDKFI